MRFVERRAEMLRETNGAKNRDHWRSAARRGNADAIRKLQWPRYPDALAYLDEMHAEFSAGRGDSPNGATWSEVESWARQTRKSLAPHEVIGLVQLDRVLVGALRNEQKATRVTPPAAQPLSWPEPPIGGSHIMAD